MKLLAILLCLLILALPASALEVEAPTVPEMGKQWMPHNTQSLAEGLLELVQKGILSLRPDLKEASRVSLGILAAVLMICTVQSVSAAVKTTAELAGTVAVAAMLLLSAKSMIRLAADTILEIGAYGKLLLPVMTTALAAQGGISGSAALYAGTALFSSILQSAMNHVLIPGIYLYLALGTGSSATGESLLKKMAQTLKGFLGWLLKGILGVFTTYLALTGVVSGTTDAAALKAAKVTMSTVIPVVGSVLSDASEAVLVSAGLMKNAAGIYGILATLALFLHPFLKIGVQYLILRVTAAICSVFGSSRVTELVEAFSDGLGLLLGMTASACVMVFISTVCFMKGVS